MVMPENPKTHGETNIQSPIRPSAQFSITPSILEGREERVNPQPFYELRYEKGATQGRPPRSPTIRNGTAS